MAEPRTRRVGSAGALGAALYAILLLGVGVPYLVHNRILQWDAPGHLHSAWYVKEYLFPRGAGWNPLFFAGFPQGVLYPFLFHWVVAALAFVVPIQTAFKLLVAASVLATPASFYYFCRGVRLTSAEAMVASVWMTAFLVIPIEFAAVNNWIGGTLASTFRVGLVANAFALPLLFFYAGAIVRRVSVGSLVPPTLLLAALVISHLMTALVGILFLLFLTVFHAQDGRVLPRLLGHALLVVTATLFWTLPFLRFLGFSDSVRLPLLLGHGSFAILSLGLGLLAWLYARRQLEGLPVLTAWFLTLMLAVLVGSALPTKLHFYRFTLYPVLLVPVLAVRAVSGRLVPVLGAIGLLACAAGILLPEPYGVRSVIRGPAGTPPEFLSEPPPGRCLILANASEQPSPDCVHHVQHAVPTHYRAPAAKGLFVESALNARSFLALERLLDPWAMAWGVPVPDVSGIGESRRVRLVARNLERLGIASVASARHLEGLVYRSRRPMLRSRTRAGYRSFSIGGVTRSVRAWHEKRYATVSSGEVVLVNDEIDRAYFSVFGGVDLSHAERATLIAGDYEYYVERVHQEVWSIDFLLPRGESPARRARPLEGLRHEVAALPEHLAGKPRMEVLLGDLEDELYEISASEASRRYADSPVVRLEPIGEAEVPAIADRVVDRDLDLDFDCYQVGDGSLVEPVRAGFGIVKREADWNEATTQWFFSPVAVHDLILAAGPLATSDSVRVRNVEWSPTMERISFIVEAERPSLVKVKVSYFPKWRAWVDGRRVPIHRAAPNFLAFEAKGPVILRYEDSLLERGATGVSVLSCIAMVGLSVRSGLLRRPGRRGRGIESPGQAGLSRW